MPKTVDFTEQIARAEKYLVGEKPISPVQLEIETALADARSAHEGSVAMERVWRDAANERAAAFHELEKQLADLLPDGLAAFCAEQSAVTAQLEQARFLIRWHSDRAERARVAVIDAQRRLVGFKSRPDPAVFSRLNELAGMLASPYLGDTSPDRAKYQKEFNSLVASLPDETWRVVAGEMREKIKRAEQSPVRV